MCSLTWWPTKGLRSFRCGPQVIFEVGLVVAHEAVAGFEGVLHRNLRIDDHADVADFRPHFRAEDGSVPSLSWNPPILYRLEGSASRTSFTTPHGSMPTSGRLGGG